MRNHQAFRPSTRYLVHYLDENGGEVAAAMRWFDVPLEVGREFAGVTGLCRIASVDPAGSAFGFGHAWAERV